MLSLLYVSNLRVHLQKQLYAQVWYDLFTCCNYSKRSFIVISEYKQAIPYLYIQLSSRRWTLRFETCRRHCKS